VIVIRSVSGSEPIIASVKWCYSAGKSVFGVAPAIVQVSLTLNNNNSISSTYIYLLSILFVAVLPAGASVNNRYADVPLSAIYYYDNVAIFTKRSESGCIPCDFARVLQGIPNVRSTLYNCCLLWCQVSFIKSFHLGTGIRHSSYDM